MFRRNAVFDTDWQQGMVTIFSYLAGPIQISFCRRETLLSSRTLIEDIFFNHSLCIGRINEERLNVAGAQARIVQRMPDPALPQVDETPSIPNCPHHALESSWRANMSSIGSSGKRSYIVTIPS